MKMMKMRAQVGKIAGISGGSVMKAQPYMSITPEGANELITLVFIGMVFIKTRKQDIVITRR